MRRRLTWALAAALAALPVAPTQAYLKLGIQAGGQTVELRWRTQPIRYFVAERGVPGVNASQLRDAIERAFAAWHSVSSASITTQFVGFTSASPFEDDGMSTLGFEDEPMLERVLGATSFLVDTSTGEILEADIFFNSAFDWSVAAGGEPEHYDLESIAVHEIGHLLGLGHSALGETELRPSGGRRVIAAESVMFPIAFRPGSIEGRTPKADDVAGVSDLYPTAAFSASTGGITGYATRGGQGAFGAHVVAFNPRDGTLVGNFVLGGDGGFVIAGLSPGPHVLRVEPLDDGDLESFFDESVRVDLDFTVTFFDRLVVVPRGGSAAPVTIAVKPK